MSSNKQSSLNDIMRRHASTPLYVPLSRWTDVHLELLGVRFSEHPTIVHPVPTIKGMLKPSRIALRLAENLYTLESSPDEATPDAIKHIMSTLFPTTMSYPETDAILNFCFAQQVFYKAVQIPCLWRIHRSADITSDPVPALPSTSLHPGPRDDQEMRMEYAPVLAYVNMSQLAVLRKNQYTAVPRPGNNEPVARLRKLQSKRLVPENADRDPYIFATLLTMAQACFYTSPSQFSCHGDRQPSHTPTPLFRDVKVQVVTHRGHGDNANFVVYTAIVTAAFLMRFGVPTSQDGSGGMEISYTPVRVYPLLGLKERLAKALGPDTTGDPPSNGRIKYWDPLLEHPQPPNPIVTRKRRAETTSRGSCPGNPAKPKKRRIR